MGTTSSIDTVRVQCGILIYLQAQEKAQQTALKTSANQQAQMLEQKRKDAQKQKLTKKNSEQ